MPIYEFHCPKCGAQFDVSRPVSKMDAPVPCPVDGAAAVRLFSMSGTMIRGGAPSIGASGLPTTPQGWSHFGHGHGGGTGGHQHGQASAGAVSDDDD